MKHNVYISKMIPESFSLGFTNVHQFKYTLKTWNNLTFDAGSIWFVLSHNISKWMEKDPKVDSSDQNDKQDVSQTLL